MTDTITRKPITDFDAIYSGPDSEIRQIGIMEYEGMRLSIQLEFWADEDFDFTQIAENMEHHVEYDRETPDVLVGFADAMALEHKNANPLVRFYDTNRNQFAGAVEDFLNARIEDGGYCLAWRDSDVQAATYLTLHRLPSSETVVSSAT